MFFLTRPSAAQIESVLNSQRLLAPRTSLAGAIRDFHAVQLGTGERVFQAAKRAMQAWEMMDLVWLRAIPSGREVAIVVRHYGFWSVNVNRILKVEDTVGKYSLKYATLPEHAESGEETFTIAHRADDSVWYEIEAFSRPRHLLAKVGYPLTRALQKRFARDSLNRIRTASQRSR